MTFAFLAGCQAEQGYVSSPRLIRESVAESGVKLKCSLFLNLRSTKRTKTLAASLNENACWGRKFL